MTVLQFIILGLGPGAVYALLGTSVAVTFQGSGVVNFAAGAVGAFGTFVFYHLHADHGWPAAPALLIGLAVSGAIGALNHLLVMKRLTKAPLATQIVATLGLMLGLIGVTNLLFAPQGSAVSVQPILPGGAYHLLDTAVPAASLLIAPIAVAVTVVIAIVQRRTRFGLATSAVAEDPLVAASMGLSSDVVAALNWALGAAVGMLAVLFAAPNQALEAQSLTLLVIPGMAAALIANFSSLTVTLLGGLALGVAQSEVGRYTTNPGWSTVVPMAIILGSLVLRGNYLPRKTDRNHRVPRVTPGRLGWRSLLWAAVGILLVEFVPPGWLASVTISVLFAFIVLSVVVLTGYAGQVSLVQLSLAGIAAFFSSALIIKAGFPVWLALIVAPLGTMVVGLIAAIPALRTRGVNLAIATLALSSLIDALIISNPTIATALSAQMPPLTLFGVKFDSVFHARNFAVLCMVILAVCVAMVTNLRRGAAGRRILAARTNERAAMALGISVPGVKMYAFAIAAFVAGVGGVLLEAQLSYASFSTFTVLGSIESTLNGVLAGAGWPSGSAVGGAISSGGVVSQALGKVVSPGNWLLVITGVGAIGVVLQSGDGMVPLNLDQFRKLVNLAMPARWRQREPKQPAVVVSGEAVREDRPPIGLEARGVTVRFGGQVALNNVDLKLTPGEVTGLIGPNGAGKSTLIDVLCGFCLPQTGTVAVGGQQIDGWTPYRRARLGMARSFQALELFDDMTILENLRAASEKCTGWHYVRDLVRPRQRELNDAARAAISAFKLGDSLDKLPSEVDYATRRLVAIARAVAGNPGILLLDEPAAGLDAGARLELRELVGRLAKDWGMAVLLVEHDVEFVFALCHRVTVLDFGNVICEGPPAEVRDNPALVASYLGDPIQESDAEALPASVLEAGELA